MLAHGFVLGVVCLRKIEARRVRLFVRTHGDRAGHPWNQTVICTGIGAQAELLSHFQVGQQLQAWGSFFVSPPEGPYGPTLECLVDRVDRVLTDGEVAAVAAPRGEQHG